MIALGLGILGYLIGSFPTGVVLSRRKFGIDVREMGSGNIGATNITRVFGWYAGALTFFADFLKGYLPLYFVARFFPLDPWFLTITGTSLVLGHCFSVYLGFRGGKGVATSVGVLTATVPWLALGCAIAYGLLLAIFRISAVGSLGGLLVAVVYLGYTRPALPTTLLISAICTVVLIRHHTNILRLWSDFRSKR